MLDDHKKNTKRLIGIKFDGKINWEALIHNQPEYAHFVTGCEI